MTARARRQDWRGTRRGGEERGGGAVAKTAERSGRAVRRSDDAAGSWAAIAEELGREQVCGGRAGCGAGCKR